MAPLFSTPLSVELWTLGFFISLCGLICLRGGKVPRCGLAPILLQYEGWICWRGSGQSKTKAESPKVHTHLYTMYFYVLCSCVRWLVQTFSPFSLSLLKTQRKKRMKKLSEKQLVDLPEFHLPVYQFAQRCSLKAHILFGRS